MVVGISMLAVILFLPSGLWSLFSAGRVREEPGMSDPIVAATRPEEAVRRRRRGRRCDGRDPAAARFVGIIGANGAGKTTFVNMVTGYLKPDAGRRSCFAAPTSPRLPPREVTRLGIRRSFQVAQLFPNLSVRDNVLVALACGRTQASRR